MVRLIMGNSGEGKTRRLLDLMNTAAESATGCMVCIEASRNMSYNLRHQTRLIDASEYSIDSFKTLQGFISGLYAGNYDISHIFVDNLCKIAHSTECRLVDDFLSWLDAFAAARNISVVLTISADSANATDVMRKYM